VPEICRFFGIVITMNFDDHLPPHFHARYGEHRATIEIGSCDVTEGWLATRQRRLVAEWARLHRDELLENWRRSRSRLPMHRIAPLA
jgi:hypothetical protein